MALSLPTSLNGECVCKLCCERVWRSVWDCDTMAWGAPVFDSQQVVKGPCPADIDWAYDGTTEDPCDAIYTQYTAIDNVCEDCSDVPQVPPAGPVLAEPSLCCDTYLCWYVWGSNPDCNTDTWFPSTPLAGPFCDLAGAIPVPFNAWSVIPFYGDCPVYIQVTGAVCVAPEDCSESPPDPDPAVPPNPPSFYDHCCPEGCCVQWITTPDDCSENTWNTPTVLVKTCEIAANCDGSWTDIGLCQYVYSVFNGGVACVDPDVDCPDGTPPPSTPAGGPNAYPGCCPCCFYLYTATYDCDTEVWDVVLSSTDCVDCDDTDPFGVGPGSIGAWITTGDPCVYVQTVAGGTFCDNAGECTPGSPPSDPLGGAAPPDCCGTCCLRIYESLYDCDTGTWSAVVHSTTFPDVTCGSDTGWTVGGSDCLYQYGQYVATGSPECGDPSINPPAPPAIGVPPDCCPSCGYWSLESLYDCDTGEWGTATFTCLATIPCGSDIDWFDPGGCIAQKYMYTPSCSIDPVSGTPGFYPASCCEGDCCYTLWASTYDCDTGTWGAPAIYDQFDGYPCDVTTGWYFGPDGTCLAFKAEYTPEGACPVSPPAAPTLGEPPDCCTVCEDCVGTQPTATSIAVVGANSCGYAAGSAAFTTSGNGINSCFWAWNQPGAADTWSVSVQFNTLTFDWLVTVIRNDAFSTNRYDTFPRGAIQCTGGHLVSGVLTLTTSGGGAACAAGDFFQVQFG
jgi:hypothetical protein